MTTQGEEVMKKFLSAIGLAVVLAFGSKAYAADIDIGAIKGSIGTQQSGIVGALSDLDSSADGTQLVDTNLIDANSIDDVTLVTLSTGIVQALQATAAVPAGAPAAAKAAATGLQSIALNSVDLGFIGDGSVISSLSAPTGSVQSMVVGATGVAEAVAEATQIHAADIITVNK